MGEEISSESIEELLKQEVRSMFLENHDYAMENGEIFPREKVSELVQEILNKFAEEGLSVNEAKLILQRTIDVVGQFSVVKIKS